MVISSGQRNTSGVICNSPCKLWGFTLQSNPTFNPTLTLHDHASAASGTVQAFISTLAGGNAVVMFTNPLRCFNGLFGALSAAQGSFVVYYEVL